ncbi:MAG: septum formation initiator family protein [Acidimicrobiia bacterium]|nr:septum formation initiator family protein [Acidimicrobiia bacterium]
MRRSPLVLLLLVALAATMSGILPFRQIIAQDRAVALSQEKLAALESETTRLEEAARLLEAPDEVERLAREEFGYVRPGEVAYVVVTAPGSVAPTVPEAAPEPPRRQWWDPITDFLTGQDLDP